MKNKEIQAILNGEAVIFPTDTVYGLGAIPKHDAIKNLYKIKNRDENKKIIALVSSVDKIKEITDEINYNVVSKFMPGPLTIVCKSNNKFKDLVGETIGIRIPNNKFALQLINSVGGILMTTSANISGEKSPVDFADIPTELLSKVCCYFKANQTLSGIPSTIVSYLNGKYTLLREGQIKFEDILKIGGIDIENDKSK
ncbi:L-threonylcarbamoyladenylate synthase [Oceanivirga salmonicida]|uniref:L-threonylcarbamoyladenylate synthase n=1 Tax=Oceanivirga salmonicida TaxID=1769291 RepID=UPI0012E31F3E|nr:L-threonylcarbamoyladenylate synthase [Oceanivirga salmonicida]